MSRDGSPWLKLMAGRIMLLPAMPRRHSLLELGQMSVSRLMAEELTPAVDKAAVGRLNRGPSPTPVGHVKLLPALLSGLRSQDLPAGEAPMRANMAINQFLACTGHEYP